MVIYTSYYANLRNLPASIIPVAISQFPPSWYKGKTLRRLAPSSELLLSYKAGTVGEDEYIRRYKAETLSAFDPRKMYGSLFEYFGGRDICLVCFERPEDFCHRHIVAEWFRSAGYDAREWQKPEAQYSLFDNETEN